VPIPLFTQSQLPPASANADGAIDLLPITAKTTGSSSARAELDLPAELMNTKVVGDDPSFTSNLSPNQLQSLDPAQQLRSAAAADAATSRPIQHPVGSSAWANEVGTRMIMMTERGQHSASLRLSPEHLGPLEVRIAVRDDQASVWFGAAHADTRAAIEQALPRLRELFASQGLSLADAGVHHQGPREQGRTPLSLSGGGLEGADDGGAISSPIAIRLGLVDAYA
jgi:flagellar hook-length control protein FliK